jgi:septal ring factor EnvC (AmiA/AmiB activator)
MRHGQALSVTLVLAVTAAGCVSSETYQAAVKESEEVKADLDREQTQTKALEQQVKSLQDQTGKLTSEAQLATAEVQRLQDSGKERSGIDGRIKEMDLKLKEMTSQNRTLLAQTDHLKKRNKQLEAQVSHAQNELKEQRAGLGGMPGTFKPSGSASTQNRPLAAAPPKGSAPTPLAHPDSESSPPQVAGGAPGQSMSQDAKSGPQGGKPETAPTAEDLSLMERLKRWLSTVWHWFF